MRPSGAIRNYVPSVDLRWEQFMILLWVPEQLSFAFSNSAIFFPGYSR
jgi:hypothetical protein